MHGGRQCHLCTGPAHFTTSFFLIRGCQSCSISRACRRTLRDRTAHSSRDAQTKRGGSCTPSWEHSLSASGTGRQKGRLFGARGVDASCRRLHFARYSLHITTQADTRHLSLHNHLQIAGVPRTRTGLFSGSMCWAGAVIGVAPCSTDSWWRCPER